MIEKKSILMTTFKFGLASRQKGEAEVPQCMICCKNLRKNAMHLSCSKRHLTRARFALVGKPKEFLVLKSHSLKKAKLDMCGIF